MQLIISKEAAKNLERLPKSENSKVRKKLLILQEAPYIGKKLSGELGGSRSLRAWPYRIIYSINNNKKVVEVSQILHRQGAYR